MGGAPQVAMCVASQIWKKKFASQTLQVFCLALRKKAQYVVVKDLFLHGKHLRTSTCFLSMKGYLLDNSLVIFSCIITLNLNTLKLYAVWYVII
jgi:hypothetical protein